MHSSVECPGFKHVVHCTALRNRRSFSVGKARWSAPIVSHKLVFSISMSWSMTWLIMLVRKSMTAHTVRRGSRSAARNIAFASSLVAFALSGFVFVGPSHELLYGFHWFLLYGVEFSDHFLLFLLFVEEI